MATGNNAVSFLAKLGAKLIRLYFSWCYKHTSATVRRKGSMRLLSSKVSSIYCPKSRNKKTCLSTQLWQGLHTYLIDSTFIVLVFTFIVFIYVTHYFKLDISVACLFCCATWYINLVITKSCLMRKYLCCIRCSLQVCISCTQISAINTL